jgi:hypothetical protein
MASVNLFSSESDICSAATTTPPSVCIVGETLIRFWVGDRDVLENEADWGMDSYSSRSN